MFEDYLAGLTSPEQVLLNISDLPRGIDNYHIDVKLSPKFCAAFKKLLADYLALETSEKPQRLKNDKQVEEFRNCYIDMVTVLINRVKTDLSPEQINFLQFAIYRFMLENTKNALDNHIKAYRDKLSELRTSGSGKALGLQEHLFWLKKHYTMILYAIYRHFFVLLRQIETKNLQALRRQYLGGKDSIFLEILFNPMLLSANLDSGNFLIERYLLWNKSRDESDFPEINAAVESMFREMLPEVNFPPLYEEKESSAQLEIYDELAGLSAAKHLLGPSKDMKNIISESFSCLDHANNFEYLFNKNKLDELVRTVKQEHGFKAGWKTRGSIKRLNKLLVKLQKFLEKEKLLVQLTASHHTHKMWSRHLAQIMDPLTLCRYLSGELTFKDFQKRLNRDYSFSSAEVKSLKQAAKDVKDEVSKHSSEILIRFLSVFAQYRLHLKYYRFAHRVFNRISIQHEEANIRLSSQAGTLYELPMSMEVINDDKRITHHSILKADVRGSTTVTNELEKKDLNPASYFSLRFFSPINKVLSLYGANKVFIEGDAVILSFLEYENDPQNWHCVAHACGMAKAMLSVVSANNKYSKDMGLPPLELGIGICYADYAPRYLYDEDQPIMISSAIGDADRMSSCTWKLRDAIQKHPFNVEVLEIARDDHSRGEKGQKQIRYNVNGILLDNVGFKKLQNEIEMTRLSGQVEGQTTVFYYGEYMDTESKKRNLVVREGRVGLWKDESIQPHTIDEKFYEVVTNPQITAGIQKKIQTMTPGQHEIIETDASTS